MHLTKYCCYFLTILTPLYRILYYRFLLLLQESVGLDGSLGSRACGNNTLAVDWVGYIACCENTRDVGGGSTRYNLDEALLVEIYLTLE